MATECAYCGSPGADTDDHIPPKSIYDQPTPASRPFVKSCLDCNNGASDDDEYFRDALVRYHRVADLPQAQRQIAAMLRAAGKPAKVAYAQRVLGSFVNVEVKSPSGLYLGQQPGYTLDAARMNRILSRYVRGLYCWETGERLPTTANVTVIVDPETMIQSQAEIREAFQGAKYTIVQGGVFWYGRQATSNPATMGWLLVFFDTMAFYAVTSDSKPSITSVA